MDDFEENFSDEDVVTESHNKLLSAVSRLYKKQRVEAARRTEPTSVISEFHLSAGTGDSEDYNEKDLSSVRLNDLLSTLKEKAIQKKIRDKVQATSSAAPVLPAPLESINATRVSRSVGYDNVKSHVSRWDGLVDKNRSSEQLKFPLPAILEEAKFQPLEFATTFTKPNELELKLAEVLKESKVYEEELQTEESIFSISVAEMIKKRKLMKKIKAQESFKIVKAMKQNKIKSKKYRKLLRQDKAKAELAEFEALKAKDPEAALAKLEKDEIERAQERASLRHRNTGKWSKGMAVRAKYDREARKELSDQVARSRELTRKKILEEEAQSDDQGENEEPHNASLGQGNNPWSSVGVSMDDSVADFMAGYKMYWKAKKEENLAPSVPSESVKIPNSIKPEMLSSSSVSSKLQSSIQSPTSISDLKSAEDLAGSSVSENKFITAENKINTFASSKDIDISGKIEDNTTLLSVLNSSCDETPSTGGIKNNSEENTENKTNMNSPENSKNTLNIDLSHDEMIPVNEIKTVKVLQNPVVKTKKLKKKNISFSNISGKWEVENMSGNLKEEDSSDVCKSNDSSQPSFHEIDKLFEPVETGLLHKMDEHFEKLNENFRNSKLKNTKTESPQEKEVTIETTPADKPSIKSTEINVEVSSSKISNENVAAPEYLNITDLISSEDKGNEMIDPNEFLPVKKIRLQGGGNTDIPVPLDSDNESDLDPSSESRQRDFQEAFASDDLISDFRKEKKEARDQREKIVLGMPGWGSWAGEGIKSNKNRRRRNKNLTALLKKPAGKVGTRKQNIILSSAPAAHIKEIMVKSVPAPFVSHKDYETSMATPIGRNWQTEIAVSSLTKPAVITKAGTIIKPIGDAQLSLYRKKINLVVHEDKPSKKPTLPKRRPLVG